MTWEDALKHASLPYMGQPTAWGERDCMQFLRAYVAGLGIDVGGDLVYGSEREGMEIIAKAGGLPELVEQTLGEHGAESDGKPGDVCVVEVNGHHSGGVHAGYCVFCIDPDIGLVRTELQCLVKAWTPWPR